MNKTDLKGSPDGVHFTGGASEDGLIMVKPSEFIFLNSMGYIIEALAQECYGDAKIEIIRLINRLNDMDENSIENPGGMAKYLDDTLNKKCELGNGEFINRVCRLNRKMWDAIDSRSIASQGYE